MLEKTLPRVREQAGQCGEFQPLPISRRHGETAALHVLHHPLSSYLLFLVLWHRFHEESLQIEESEESKDS